MHADLYIRDVMPPKQISVRGVSPQLGRRLAELSQARGKSVNAVVLELLERAAGLDGRKEWLRRFMTWTVEEVRDFDAVLRDQRTVDEKLWR